MHIPESSVDIETEEDVPECMHIDSDDEVIGVFANPTTCFIEGSN